MENRKNHYSKLHQIKHPSIIQIISNDPFTVVLGITLPFVFWIIYIAMNVFGISFTNDRSDTTVSADGSLGQLLIPISATIIGLIITILRFNHFNRTFKYGVVVMGEILQISLPKDRGTISYSFRWEGVGFEGFNDIMSNSKTKSFKKGDLIPIIVNSKNPKKSLIKDLFA